MEKVNIKIIRQVASRIVTTGFIMDNGNPKEFKSFSSAIEWLVADSQAAVPCLDQKDSVQIVPAAFFGPALKVSEILERIRRNS